MEGRGPHYFDFANAKDDESRFARMQDLVGDQLDIHPDKVTLESNFVEDLGADSLDVVEIIIKIEFVFKLKVNDDIASEIATVKDLVDYMKSQSPE